jgi:hypothetical protein
MPPFLQSVHATSLERSGGESDPPPAMNPLRTHNIALLILDYEL